jgi:hypothetical protein
MGNIHFTQQQAEAKIEKPVRVRDDTLADYGLTKGTVGRVTGARGGMTFELPDGKTAPGWVVNVEFPLAAGSTGHLLLTKPEYERSLEEL